MCSLCATRRLVRELYGKRRGSVDPVYLVRRLGALGAALGEDFTDGGQHDCEEVLSAIIDRLHEDLVGFYFGQFWPSTSVLLPAVHVDVKSE